LRGSPRIQRPQPASGAGAPPCPESPKRARETSPTARQPAARPQDTVPEPRFGANDLSVSRDSPFPNFNMRAKRAPQRRSAKSS
jgi:hypothetical protein